MLPRLSIVALLALATTACTTPGTVTKTYTETLELSPQAQQWWDDQVYAYPANDPVYKATCPLDKSGLAPVFPREGFINVGYQHSYDPGAKIFPCTRLLDDTYRGAVKFDLSRLHQHAPYVFVKSAVLGFRRFHVAGDHDCADTVMAATEAWAPVPASGVVVGTLFPAASDEYFDGTVLKCAGYDNCRQNKDVTNLVNAWALGTAPEFGFVFKGENEQTAAKENTACRTEYGEFHLSIEYSYDVRTPPGK